MFAEHYGKNYMAIKNDKRIEDLIKTFVDTIEGKAFINDAGNIDAVLDLDGETILLSELQESGMLNNC